MKVRVSIEVLRAARLRITQEQPTGSKNRRGEASRETIRAYLQQHVQQLARDYVAPESAIADGEAAEAIDWLKKAGWTPSRIKSWLLTQRALVEALRERRTIE